MEFYLLKKVLTNSDNVEYVSSLQRQLSACKVMKVLGAREYVDKIGLTRKDKTKINKEITAIEVLQHERASHALQGFNEYSRIIGQLSFAQDQYRIAYEKALIKATQGMWKYHHANIDVLTPGNCAHMKWIVNLVDEVMDLILEVKYVGIELLKELRYIEAADLLVNLIIVNGHIWNRNVAELTKQREFARCSLQKSGFKLWMAVQHVKAKKVATKALKKVANGAAELVML